MPLILGLTGNIASGKSSIAREFERYGAVVVDADELAREAVEPDTAALTALVAAFGRGILRADGRLDRERLGEIVFSDTGKRQQLNAIVHPAIAELAEARLAALRERNDIPLIVYEAPLLFEAGAEGRVDRVLVVTIDAEKQLQRLTLRDDSDADAAKKRIAAQMPQAEKVARADYVIDNSGTFELTRKRVESLWLELVGVK